MRRLLLVLALLAATTGCGDAPDPRAASAPLAGRPADLAGEITSSTPYAPVTDDCVPPDRLNPDEAVSSDDPPVCADPDSDVLGAILVEEDTDAAWEGDKGSVTVRTSTTLVGAERFADLGEGVAVRVWFDGAVAESYPVQGDAAAIEVLEPSR